MNFALVEPSKNMRRVSRDSFDCRETLRVGGNTYSYYSLSTAERNGLAGLSRLPFSLKVLFENILRNEDHLKKPREQFIQYVCALSWGDRTGEIQFFPSRVLMQDAAGLPAMIDLAAMRDAVVSLGLPIDRINPQIPVDLVIDHSLDVHFSGTDDAARKNVEIEYRQNEERYRFLKWAQKSFQNFRVIPSGGGICHQVNLEYLAEVVSRQIQLTGDDDDIEMIFPDTLVGTDSHTTMVNALSVLGWGVGGIEAEAALLGLPCSMVLPEVVGVHLTGRLLPGTTATDLALTLTHLLRKHGVVGKFVEFCGPALASLGIMDRATIANMAPEYGATCGFFPVDDRTIRFLRETNREARHVDLVQAYCQAQGIYWDETTAPPLFTETISLDLRTVEPSASGPARPQDRIALSAVQGNFRKFLGDKFGRELRADNRRRHCVDNKRKLEDGDIAIAAIASCTNTANPHVMMAAALLAKKAVEKGLAVKPWVKTSLSPGSRVVAKYYETSGLQRYLDRLGFNIVGFGCATCVGNSGPLPLETISAIEKDDLAVVSVLSGNRNFEGRIHSHVRANYLVSPPLVIAYAIAGSVAIDLTQETVGYDAQGKAVMLSEIWPSEAEIDNAVNAFLTRELFEKSYSEAANGGPEWQRIEGTCGAQFPWDSASTYIRRPPFVETLDTTSSDIEVIGARILALLGDSITTDHISPVGAIALASPAGEYLRNLGVSTRDFNQYGARRGNHDVMVRGTFANRRLRNQIADGEEGGVTIHFPSKQRMSIYDAAMKYQSESVPTVIFAGKEYGTGSARDWAAKGTALLGVRAIIAQSFERIHRANLIGMGVFPLEFCGDVSWQSLGLTGAESISVAGISRLEKPRQTLQVEVTNEGLPVSQFSVRCCIETMEELDYVKSGGILKQVLKSVSDQVGPGKVP